MFAASDAHPSRLVAIDLTCMVFPSIFYIETPRVNEEKMLENVFL